MRVRILYCRPCGYRGRAEALANELRTRFGAHVDVAVGKLGHFDVLVEDVLVASRGKSLVSRLLPPPKSAAIVAAIEAHLATQEGEHCDLPATARAAIAASPSRASRATLVEDDCVSKTPAGS